MDTIRWLQENAPGFPALSEAEIEAITVFSFLWSLFEAKAMNENGNANTILTSATRWSRDGQLTPETFDQELAYFRARYVTDGQTNDHFDHLHLRANDAPDLVLKVLSGEDGAPEEIAAAVLIIVYRFRNNLFHGAKWAYELRGQLDNFTHSNNALMRAIELQDGQNAGEPA